MYALVSLNESKILGRESLIIPAWVKCPSCSQRKVDHLISGSQWGRGNFAPSRHLALSGDILGHQWVVTTRDAKYAKMHRTASTTKNPPASNVNSAEAEKPWPQLIVPKGMQKGHFFKEKLKCVEDTSTVCSAQIPLNPFGCFSFPLPQLVFYQLPSATFFKGCSLGCWRHLQTQKAGIA